MGQSESKIIKNGVKVRIEFLDVFSTKVDKNVKQKLTKLMNSNSVRKYVMYNANLYFGKKNDFPSGFNSDIIFCKLKIIKCKAVGTKLICYGTISLTKNIEITQNDYISYISSGSNGPFEQSWDNCPHIKNKGEVFSLNLQTPNVIFT